MAAVSLKALPGSGLWWLLLLMAAVIIAARAYTFYEPLERDITTYAVVAHEMMRGRPLYAEMWDIKPPAIFVTYALAEIVAGYGRLQIFLLGVSAAILTLLAVYHAAFSLGVNKSNSRAAALSGLIAAGLWTIICHNLYLQANQPNTEVFINACMAAGFLFVVRSGNKEVSSPGRCVAMAALLLSLASTFKQVTVAPTLLFCLAHICFPVVGAKNSQSLKQAFFIISSIALTWMLIATYFWVTGHFDDFYYTMVVFGKSYAGSPAANLWKGLQWRFLFPPIVTPFLPLLLLSCVALVLGVKSGDKRNVALLSAYLIGTQIAIALPGQFYGHYYQLWLPPLTIGAGWGICQLATRFKPAIAHCTAAVVIALFLLHQASFYALSPQEWAVRKYNSVFIAEEQLAHRINQRLLPGETFCEWGSEAGLYFYTGTSPISGIVNHDVAIKGPRAREYAARISRDFMAAKPSLIIWHRNNKPPKEFVSWLNSNYLYIPQKPQTSFFLFVRRDSNLLKRLKTNS